MTTVTAVHVESAVGALPWQVLRFVGQMAEPLSTRAFLVGGAVRDAALGVACTDIDVMLERDLDDFLEMFSRQWPNAFSGLPPIAKTIRFKKYLTAKVFFAGEIVRGLGMLEFSQARRESYAQPGVPPIACAGTVEEDLARRDFSLNALAFELTPPRTGMVLDPCGGLSDLEQGVVRILHERSFEDDPARLIRAMRFSVRFGFTLEAQTARRFSEAICSGGLRRLSEVRLLDELRKALCEPQLRELLFALKGSGVLDEIMRSVGAPTLSAAELERIAEGKAEWSSVFAGLFARLPRERFEELLCMLALSRAQRSLLEEEFARWGERLAH